MGRQCLSDDIIAMLRNVRLLSVFSRCVSIVLKKNILMCYFKILVYSFTLIECPYIIFSTLLISVLEIT